MEELAGSPIDGITLTVYGKRGLETVLQTRLLTHGDLDDVSAKVIKKIAADLAEEALKYARDFVFDHRILNGQIIHKDRLK